MPTHFITLRALRVSWLACALFIATLTTRAAFAEPLTPRDVPAPLVPWIPWVLDASSDAACPTLGDTPVCAWPGRLQLDVKKAGGSFTLAVVTDRNVAVTLPGGAAPWPQDVEVDGKDAVVLEIDGKPSVMVTKGTHRILGKFAWTTAPDGLFVPKTIGVVELTLDGERVAFPKRTDERLWLESSAGASGEPERVELEVFRRIDDGVPLRVTTRLDLRVSGRARELQIRHALLAGSQALSLGAELPVRLEKDGTVIAQVRAGQHTITLDAHFASPPESLDSGEHGPPWPEREVWVWSPNPKVRETDVVGGTGIDASRTNLPADWKALRAIHVAPRSEIRFVTSRRGEPEPPPNALHLDRSLWLDVGGAGFTLRDRWSGQMNRAWRLNAREGTLGHVKAGGENQLITMEGDARGVELRAGNVDVLAEGRLDARGDLPAVGWSESVQSLAATLHLPPGWELLGATGVDTLENTWVSSWDLFAVFFALVVALATAKLAGPRWGVIALCTLVATHQREGAPHYVWAVLLVAMALLRVVPEGGFRHGLRACWVVVACTLVVVSATFGITQLKVALFPATADPSWALRHAEQVMDAKEGGTGTRAGGELESAAAPLARKYGVLGPSQDAPEAKPVRALAQDPAAVIQTGPGVPTWSWSEWRLGWTGPVASDHRVRLFLLSPAVSAALGILRVALVALLAFALLRRSWMRREPPPRRPGPAARVAAAAAFGLVVLGGPRAASAEIPSKDVLDDLRERLTGRPACHPKCTSVSRLDVRVSISEVQLTADVHVGGTAALQLPGPAASWTPRDVSVDGKPASAIVLGQDGFLHLRLEAGRHIVRLSGPTPGDELTLALGQTPRHVVVTADGWTVDGIAEDGATKGSIHLARVAKADTRAEVAGVSLPPWFEVTRALSIGVSWRVQTKLRRVSPTGSPVVVRLGLLRGERVTTEGVQVESGEAVLSFDRDQGELTFESSLEPRDALELAAARGRPWTEIWTLACGPVWHCTSSGVAPVTHQRDGMLAPEFRPWPGEKVALSFTRPGPAPGESLTIDSAHLEVTPGTRLTSAKLSLVARTTTGGVTTVTLPAGADVRKLVVEGNDAPIRLEDRRLSFTVAPGTNQVGIEWQEPTGLSTSFTVPAVELGSAAVNARVSVELPAERWLLFVRGPTWGPAVLFWLYLALALVAAFLILPRIPRNPLRGHQWALLALGFTQVHVATFLVVAAWFFGVSHREALGVGSPWRKNLIQLALVGATVVSLGCLIAAVYTGLATNVEMYVEGGGSHSARLVWYADRVGGAMPTPTVFSLPLWVWRVTMLAWSLWLAVALLSWLRWAWRSFSTDGLWANLGIFGRTPAYAGAPAASQASSSASEGDAPPAEPAPDDEAAKPGD